MSSSNGAKKFNVPVRRATGEELTELEVKDLIQRPHLVEFTYGGAVFAMQVSPSQITGKHNTQIEAIRMKLARVLDFSREEAGDKKTLTERAAERVAAGKAIDVAAVAQVYEEMNAASVQRVVDAIMREEDGSLMCNFADEAGKGLTPLLLLENAALGQTVVGAFEAWYDLFTGQSPVGGETKTETGATLTMNTPAQTEAEATPA